MSASIYLRGLPLFVTPAIVALLSWFAAPWAMVLPPELAGLQQLGPLVALAFAGAVSAAFNRGRALLAVSALAVAWVGYEAVSKRGVDDPGAAVVFLALCALLPAHLGILAIQQERGAGSRYAVRRAFVLGAGVCVVAVLAQVVTPGVLQVVRTPWLLLAPAVIGPIPPLGIAACCFALVAASLATLRRNSAIDAGIAGAVVVAAFAAYHADIPLAPPIYLAFGALMLAVGVLQDAHRLAFRDELTGLPSRRALNERLLALGGCYAIAMVDVDHFKRLNDSYGHDVGDQVLKMVAAQLERVGGGARVYRFGGEEFAVVFPGQNTREAIPHLEELRRAVAGYEMAIRGFDRPRDRDDGRARRGARRSSASVSVTVSIGVAAPDERHTTPDAVLKAADEALYRAKDRGRNRISR